MNKTIEELERELHNAKASLSYHKNKGRGKGRGRAKPKGESPRARANRLAGNIVWNDEKKAMAHVVAFLTANDGDYKAAFNQAHTMPVEDIRELVKGHEDEVEKHIKALQEKRAARKKAKEPQQLPLELSQGGMYASPTAEQDFDDAITKMLDEAWPDTPAVKEVVPKSSTPNYQVGRDSAETCPAVPIKATTLRLAKEVVSELTGFEGLSDEQIVGHILNRYLQYNKDGKL